MAGVDTPRPDLAAPATGMNTLERRLLPGMLCMTLVACGNDRPSGQVVATVNGQEITASELQLELGELAGDAEPGSDAQRAVLRALVARRQLVAEARARRLDTSPDGRLARERAKDLALVEFLRQDIAGTAPVPSLAELDRYVAAQPETFAGRQLVTADQIIVRDGNPALVQALRNAGSWSEAQAVLAEKAVPRTNSTVILDTLNLPPASRAAIAGSMPGAMIVEPNGAGAIRLLRVTDRQSAPLYADQARTAARLMIVRDWQQRTRARLDQIVRAGNAERLRAPSVTGT